MLNESQEINKPYYYEGVCMLKMRKCFKGTLRLQNIIKLKFIFVILQNLTCFDFGKNSTFINFQNSNFHFFTWS